MTSFINKKTIIGLVLLTGFIATNWYWLDYRSFVKTPIDFSEHLIFTVSNGENISTLANQLTAKGLIPDAWYLKLLIKFRPELAKLKVGEYQLEKQMRPEALLQRLTSGAVIQYEFTIIEGQTFIQVLQNLSKQERLQSLDSFSDQDLDYSIAKLASQLNIAQDNPEGWFFPDTYFYSKGESSFSLLRRAVKKMQSLLQTEWENKEKNLPYKSAYEALIMASIIEKETGIASERAKIAGVFVRRLNKQMRLQTDPTVIYGIGVNFDGNITRRHLKTVTPYNTYVIKGLPPTPIATPSRESIHAALHPEAGDELYFVADGTGGHYFSKTHEEHLKAVQRMLKRDRIKRNKTNKP